MKEGNKGDKVPRSERYFGKVSRFFRLGQDADEATAQTKYSDGILALALPRRVGSKAGKLDIM